MRRRVLFQRRARLSIGQSGPTEFAEIALVQNFYAIKRQVDTVPDMFDTLVTWLNDPVLSYFSWLAWKNYAESTKKVYLLIRPGEVLNCITAVPILEVAHDARRIAFQAWSYGRSPPRVI